MKKCPETVTGKHKWTDKHELEYRTIHDELGGWICNDSFVATKWYKKCCLCGLIDDRKVYKEKT